MNAAKNPYGSLIFFIGTPPRPIDDSGAFTAKRRGALSGKSRNGLYIEIAGHEDLDPHGELQYRTANPAYPTRVPPAAMSRMAENLPDGEAWRREALGIWDKDEVTTDAPPVLTDWPSYVAPGPPMGECPIGYGIDRSALHGSSVWAAWRVGDERLHVEEVFTSHDNTATADFVAKVSRPTDIIFIDNLSAAAPLIPLLAARKRNPMRSSATEYTAACALLEEALESGRLTHTHSPEMEDAISRTQKRDVRGGGWAWEMRDKGAPIHRVSAASLAVLAAARKPATATNRRSSRKRNAAA
ncbi:hypothetical protein [Gordonia sp. DT101]|uniref:hypothetical protein n=1 Tax=Gordonia sp. DT101 TaxID=3416545 RepID=UPI003CF90AAC